MADFGDRATTWARGFFAALGRFHEGVYINSSAATKTRPGPRGRTPTPSTTAGGVKPRYDPDNVSHHNQAICPR